MNLPCLVLAESSPLDPSGQRNGTEIWQKLNAWPQASLQVQCSLGIDVLSPASGSDGPVCGQWCRDHPGQATLLLCACYGLNLWTWTKCQQPV